MRSIAVLLALFSLLFTGVLSSRTEDAHDEAHLKSEERKIERSLQFLAQKEAEPGVVKLPSGLMYKVLVPGTGPSPLADTKVRVHYEARLSDGTEIDSSHQRGKPLTLAPKQTPIKVNIRPKWENDATNRLLELE